MNFGFEKLAKSTKELYKEASNKMETLTTSHEEWYSKAEDEAKLFLKDIDPALKMWIKREPLMLHFYHDAMPLLNWDMEIDESNEYIDTQLKEAVMQKYAEKYEELKKEERLHPEGKMPQVPDLKWLESHRAGAKNFEGPKLPYGEAGKIEQQRGGPQSQEYRKEKKSDEDLIQEGINTARRAADSSSSGSGDFFGGGGSSGGAGASGKW